MVSCQPSYSQCFCRITVCTGQILCSDSVHAYRKVKPGAIFARCEENTIPSNMSAAEGQTLSGQSRYEKMSSHILSCRAVRIKQAIELWSTELQWLRTRILSLFGECSPRSVRSRNKNHKSRFISRQANEAATNGW